MGAEGIIYVSKEIFKKRADRRVAAMYFRGAKDRIFLFFFVKRGKNEGSPP